jgi:pimeloyl-ACP methyl ester carboxylesterase
MGLGSTARRRAGRWHGRGAFPCCEGPERVTSLTTGGGAVHFPIDAGGALKETIEAPTPDDVRALDARTNIGYAVEPAAPSASEPEAYADYVALTTSAASQGRRGSCGPTEQNPVLHDLLTSITTPTQIMANLDDDLVPWSNSEYLDDILPNSEMHALDASHFAWEEAAEEYCRLVADWVSGRYRRVADRAASRTRVPHCEGY